LYFKEFTISSGLVNADADDNTLILHVDAPATIEADIEEVDGVNQQSVHNVYENKVLI
jgi:hypothetical protein